MFNLNNFLVLSIFLIGVNSLDLPQFLTKCSRDMTRNELSVCIKEQAIKGQPYFVDGVPAYGLERADPLMLNDLDVHAGTFTIKSKNITMEGLRHIEIRDVLWDINKLKGHITMFGNLTVKCDYDLDGFVVVLPLKSKGKITVKLINTEITYTFKCKLVKDNEGVEHWQIYDTKYTVSYGGAKFAISNLLGGGTLGDTIVKVFNENWRELANEIGPSYIEATGDKCITGILNKFLMQIPYEKVL